MERGPFKECLLVVSTFTGMCIKMYRCQNVSVCPGDTKITAGDKGYKIVRSG